MFWLLAIGSMFGYALQSVLLAHYARKIDGLSVGFYRGASFVVTMLPLLIGSTTNDVIAVFLQWPYLLLSAVGGGLYMGLIYAACRYMPIAVSTALTRAAGVIVLTCLGFVFLHQSISFDAFLLILGIVCATLFLAFLRTPMRDLHTDLFVRGSVLSLLAAVPFATNYYAVTVMSRHASPLVSGYFWEVSIAVGCGFFILIRSLFTTQRLAIISPHRFAHIALYASPTIIGTGLFSLATRQGPVAVANAIGSASILVISLLAWWLYGEKLHSKQWIAMLILLVCLVGLPFV